MAKIQANDMSVQMSSDGVTYKTLVCEIGHTLNKTRDTQSTPTKCDGGTPAVSIGAKTAALEFTAAVETAPAAGQCSFTDVDGWYEAGTYMYWKIVSGTNIYQQGRGYLTALSIDAQVGGIIQVTGTLQVDGAIDTTP